MSAAIDVETAEKALATRAAEGKLRGWKLIANYLEVSETAAQQRAARERDPLPVHHDHRGPYSYASALRDWVGRSAMAYQAHLQLTRQRSRRGAAPAP